MSKLIQKIRDLKSPIDIFHYCLGNYRYKIYYFRKYKQPNSLIRQLVLALLLREYIVEQIDYRIRFMDQECYNNGSCKICGCSTTALQMCNKSCDKPCYPKMMNSSQWNRYKRGHSFTDNNGVWLALLSQNLKPTLFKRIGDDLVPQIDIIPEETVQRNSESIQQDHNTGHY